MVKLSDRYPCILCTRDYPNLRQYKRHVLLRHHLADIEQKLKRPLAEIMGKRDFNESRTVIFNSIRKGKFEDFVVKLLSDREPFTLDGIDRRLPLVHDQDALSKQKRKSLYIQGRDLLMKVADETEPGVRLDSWQTVEVKVKDEVMSFSWNLSQDFNYENFPGQVAHCLMYALQA